MKATKYTSRLVSTSFGVSLYHLKRTKVEGVRVFEVVAERLELLVKVDREFLKRVYYSGLEGC